MNSISRRFYETVVQGLNQLPIRGNRHKVTLFMPFDADQSKPSAHQLTELDSEQTAFAFTIMFERNNPESAWRLVTPLNSLINQ